MRLFGHLAAILLSCLIAHATGGLWETTKIRVEQPRVSFTYDALLIVEVIEQVAKECIVMPRG